MSQYKMTKKINNWEYNAEVDFSTKKMSLYINPDRKTRITEKLVKYYGLSKYSVDAIVNKYLYASHPFDLNDPFDCFFKLVSFNDIPLEICVRFMKVFNNSEEEAKKLYEENRQKLFATIEAIYYDYIYSMMGIISTTNNQLDIKMWAYYTGHKGFQISFKTSNLSKKLHGPFPINYVESSDAIEFSDNGFISALFQTNVKSQAWKPEKEWRYVYESFDRMRLPNHPEFDDIFKERKAYYDKNDVNEIVFGFSFFDKNLCVDFSNETATYDYSKSIDKETISKLLDFVIDNKINTSLVYLKSDLDFKLTKKLIKVTKLDEYRYSCRRLQ